MSDDQPEEPERIAARPEFREMIREANLLAPDLLLFSWSRSYPVSLALMGFVGFGMMVQLASSNTILQTVVDDDKRGRVMSLYATSFLGMAPFGSLLMGALASQVGAPVALTVGGAGCLVGAIAFHRHLPALREHVRPIYERMGILPEIATGLQSATEPVLPAGRRAFEP